MAIDVLTEDVRSFSEWTKAKVLPVRRRGSRVNLATLYRWAQRGVRGVRLESVMVGAVRCTSAEALQRFFEILTAQADGQAATPDVRTPTQRRRAANRAARELEREGV
jgi:hypothetical protein